MHLWLVLRQVRLQLLLQRECDRGCVQLLLIVQPNTAILIHLSTTSSASVLLYPWEYKQTI